MKEPELYLLVSRQFLSMHQRPSSFCYRHTTDASNSHLIVCPLGTNYIMTRDQCSWDKITCLPCPNIKPSCTWKPCKFCKKTNIFLARLLHASILQGLLANFLQDGFPGIRLVSSSWCHTKY